MTSSRDDGGEVAAREAIRALLDGQPPNGVRPEDCGPWGETIAALQAAFLDGGTLSVQAMFSTLVRADPAIAHLVAANDGAGDFAFFLQESADDEGNAQCVLRLYRDRFLYCESIGWLRWNGRYYDTSNSVAHLVKAIVRTLRQRRSMAVQAENEAISKVSVPNAFRVRNCMFMLQALVSVDVNVFDSSPDLINCANGAVDLRTGEIVPHDPGHRFTYCTTAAYDPAATWEEWEAFLLAVTQNRPALVDFIQVAAGYSLTGHTREECVFYLWGPTRGGKGTFFETILEMLGKMPLATEVDFATFTARRDQDAQNFDLAPLKPCRFVAASESSKYSQINAAKLKQLTGGNDVRCAFKHKNHFTYRPQFKIWLSSNYPPNADVDDDAVWNRLRVIEFPNSFVGQEDKLLKERMKDPASLRSVLAWAVAGAIRWYGLAGTGLQTPEEVRAATDHARQELDVVAQWLEECVEITLNQDDFEPNHLIYASYSDWCKSNGVTAKHQRSLTMALKRKGLDYAIAKWQGRTSRGWRGIRLVTVTQWYAN